MARNPKPVAEEAKKPEGETEGIAQPPVVPPRDEQATELMVVVITATIPRRRRAGRSFGPTPTRIPVADLTHEDFDALAADRLLKIHMEPAEEPADD